MASRKKIKESLLEQIRRKGGDPEYLQDIVEQYMSLWHLQNELKKDIESRGITYIEYSSNGNPVNKNNPSTKELVAVSKQMLSILKDLGINTAIAAEEDDEL